MQLSGLQLGHLHKIICDLYNYDSLAQLLRYRLDLRLDNVASKSNFTNVVYEVLEYFNQNETVSILIQSIRESKPSSDAVFEFCNQLDHVNFSSLESIIKKSNSFFDISMWRSQMASIENQVCLIERQETAQGTGFLIGADLVLTNHHVICQQGSMDDVPLSDFSVRFDHKKNVDGSTNFGIRTSVTEIVASSIPQNLDYALLRIADSLGQTPVGKQCEPGAELRGFICLPTTEPVLEVDSGIMIVQHPDGSSLKIAFDSQSVIGYRENGRRLQYRTNTAPGSSGSPCFNFDWKLIALHHAGDPEHLELKSNYGIPIWKIITDLKTKNIAV